jgi:hypothetical protein
MTWLEQRRPGDSAELLQDYPGKLVHIDCRHCDRTGRYGLAGLVRLYGPAAALPEVLATLSADCPRQQDWRTAGPCGAGFPGWCRGRRPSRR